MVAVMVEIRDFHQDSDMPKFEYRLPLYGLYPAALVNFG